MKATISNRLKEYMNISGFKQVDILNACDPFCKKYGIKLGRNDLSQYISGKTSPRQDKLSVLASGMGVDEAWLMGYDVPMYNRRDHGDNGTFAPDEIAVMMAYRAALPAIKSAVKRLLDIDAGEK